MTVMKTNLERAVLAQAKTPVLHRFAARRRLDRHHEQPCPLLTQYFDKVQLFGNWHIEPQAADGRAHRLRTEHVTIHSNAKLARIMLKQLCGPPATLRQQ